MKHHAILALGLLAAVLAGASGCEKKDPKKPVPAQMLLNEAVDQGVVQISAHGISLEKISVSISCPHKTTIQIPAGTVFLSGNTAHQNMMTATSVTIAFRGSADGKGPPHTETRELDVYCVNRWLDIPQKATSFTVAKRDPVDPLAKLAACLEGTKAEHEVKQFAIWLVSDNIWDLTIAQYVEREIKEVEDKFAKEIKQKDPTIPAAEFDRARRMVREEMKGLPASRVAIRDRVRPLLEQCGFDVSNKPFFRN